MNNKINIAAAVAAAVVLASSAGYSAVGDGVEKCRVVKNGKGLIKTAKADCRSGAHSCASMNKAGDPESWINVSKGQCAKINAGDLTGVSEDIKDKIDIKELVSVSPQPKAVSQKLHRNEK